MQNKPILSLLFIFSLIAMLSACGSESDNSDATDPTDTEETGNTNLEANCAEPTEVQCVDNLVLDLSFQNSVAEAGITTTKEGTNWVTNIDATAGGYMNAADNPWIYVRFTENGAEKVEINDNESLESMDWHLAAHRFKIRLNSGSGGPSCVQAAVLLEGDYDAINEVPENLTFYKDSFYTADCSLVSDSYGMGSPQVFMSNWWSYSGCVATTLVPFIIQLEDGNTIKLRVEEYYQEGQQACNDTDATGSGSANLKVRWAFL